MLELIWSIIWVFGTDTHCIHQVWGFTSSCHWNSLPGNWLVGTSFDCRVSVVWEVRGIQSNMGLGKATVHLGHIAIPTADWLSLSGEEQYISLRGNTYFNVNSLVVYLHHKYNICQHYVANGRAVSRVCFQMRLIRNEGLKVKNLKKILYWDVCMHETKQTWYSDLTFHIRLPDQATQWPFILRDFTMFCHGLSH